MKAFTEANERLSAPAWRVVECGAVLLFVIALVVSAVHATRHAGDLYVTPHAFVSADVATTARTFSREGVLRLRGVPVNNNPPIAEGDFYTHWPPLLPVSLSFAFRAFGASERTAHLFMLVVLVATAVLIYFLGRQWLGPAGGALSAFFWLTLPVVVQFGDLVAQQAVAMLFVVAALLAYEKSTRWSSILLFLAVVSAWEAALVAPALWVVSRRHEEMRRRASFSLIGTAAGLLLVGLLFLGGNPKTALDTLHAAEFYMGISQVYAHVNPLQQIPLPIWTQLRLTLLNNVWMLGPIGLGAVVLFGTSRPKAQMQRFLPLAAPWLVWCIVMHNHTARHPFEFLIAAPAVALSLAWFTLGGDNRQPKQVALRAAIFALLAIVQLIVLPRPSASDGYDPARLVEYGKSIRACTPEGSVVMAPLESSVPLYYSERHIVRNIDSPQTALQVLPELHRSYPHAPVYVALPPFLKDKFRMEGAKTVCSTSEAIVLQVN